MSRPSGSRFFVLEQRHGLGRKAAREIVALARDLPDYDRILVDVRVLEEAELEFVAQQTAYGFVHLRFGYLAALHGCDQRLSVSMHRRKLDIHARSERERAYRAGHVDRHALEFGVRGHHTGKACESNRRLEGTGIDVVELARTDGGRRHVLTALCDRIAEEASRTPAHPRADPLPCMPRVKATLIALTRYGSSP
jgi:hypothetical protein